MSSARNQNFWTNYFHDGIFCFHSNYYEKTKRHDDDNNTIIAITTY